MLNDYYAGGGGGGGRKSEDGGNLKQEIKPKRPYTSTLVVRLPGRARPGLVERSNEPALPSLACDYGRVGSDLALPTGTRTVLVVQLCEDFFGPSVRSSHSENLKRRSPFIFFTWGGRFRAGFFS